LIVHGTITRFRVRNGEIGLAWDNNKPVFIEKPDFYQVDSPSFTFVNCVNSSEKMIILGSSKRIVVYDGEVGVSYVNGRLDILQPNTHVFDSVERIFAGFLSTKQQSIHLLEPGSKDLFLHCDTKEFVEIGVKAAVFYRICDPAKSLLTVGNDQNIQQLIRETGIATLQGIMRSSALNQVAQSKVVDVSDKDIEKIKAANAASGGPELPNAGKMGPVFFDKVHDEFIHKLHDNFKGLYGIEISNIRINDIQIMSPDLADNISKQAIITAQTETKLTNLTSQREIATTETERDAAVARIKTAAAAQQLQTDTQARTSATISSANAKAAALKIEAMGIAQSTLVKAEAEAKAIELKASAEKKRAQDLSSTPLGEKLALLSVQSEMIQKSMEGVTKIIYLPTNMTTGQSPIQLFGMPGMGIPPMDGMEKRVVSK